MKLKTSIKAILFLVISSLALTACVPISSNALSYDVAIIEINNPRIEGNSTIVDVKVVNRGCPPQSFLRADVEKLHTTINIGIRYINKPGISACATYEVIHSINLGKIPSGEYTVKGRGQSEPYIRLIVP